MASGVKGGGAQGADRGHCAEAACEGCGKRDFGIGIFACGYAAAYCTACGQRWPGAIRGPWFDAGCDEAVGEVKNVAPHLVSEAG